MAQGALSGKHRAEGSGVRAGPSWDRGQGGLFTSSPGGPSSPRYPLGPTGPASPCKEMDMLAGPSLRPHQPFGLHLLLLHLCPPWRSLTYSSGPRGSVPQTVHRHPPAGLEAGGHAHVLPRAAGPCALPASALHAETPLSGWKFQQRPFG